MPLTETKIKNLKPQEKSKKYYDEQGLFLLVKPNKSKLWRFKYYFEGKEKLISLGAYPAVSLKEARDVRREFKSLLSQGINPSEYKQNKRLQTDIKNKNSFEKVALEWHDRFSVTLGNDATKTQISSIRRDLIPWIGKRPISEIEPPELLECIRRIEDRGALDVARRTLSLAGRIFRYGVQTGRAKRDPSQDLKGAIATRKTVSFAAITDPKDVGELMRRIDSYETYPPIALALKVMPLVFVRSIELRNMKWDDVDFENREWSFNVSKTDIQLIVPLSYQAIEILETARLFSGGGDYAFPNYIRKNKPINENAINLGIRAIGYKKGEMTGHGFRAMARTILDEVLGYRVDIIEHQLGHAVKDPNGNAYNRTKHLSKRKEMMQDWSDYLYSLRDS